MIVLLRYSIDKSHEINSRTNLLKGGVMWDMAPTLGQYRVHYIAVEVNWIICGEMMQQMGTWLNSNVVFWFEFEWDKCAVFAGTICREVYRTYILARRVSFLFFFLVLWESVLWSVDWSDLHLLRRRGQIVRRIPCEQTAVPSLQCSLIVGTILRL